MDVLSPELIEMIFECSTIIDQLALSQASSGLRSYRKYKLTHYVKFRDCLRELTNMRYVIIDKSNGKNGPKIHSLRVFKNNAILYRLSLDTSLSNNYRWDLNDKLWIYHSKKYARRNFDPNVRSRVKCIDYPAKDDDRTCFENILDYLGNKLELPLMLGANTTVIHERLRCDDV